MEIIELVKALVFLIGGVIAITLMRLGIKILSADREDYRRNKAASPRKRDPFLGTLSTFNLGARSHEICAGLAVNDKNEWVEQGKLSESAMDAILR